MSSSTATFDMSGWDSVAGFFTYLVLAALMALQNSTLVLLYASTTSAVIINILEIQASILDNILESVGTIWDRATPEYEIPASILDPLSSGPSDYGSCANTAALTVNILLGDSVVCWRAWLLWPGNRVVRLVSILLLLTTFALGAVDLKSTCYLLNGKLGGSLNGNAVVPGGMYAGTPYGIAATVLSLSVNLFATILVAYKAWKSRRFLRKLMVLGDKAIRMERLFSILIESGMVYCTIWIFVVAWQISMYHSPVSFDIDPTFQGQFSEFMGGGLIPIIAIYPAVVIILVALNRSHLVKALSGGEVNTPRPSRFDGILVSSATVVHIASQGDQVRDGSEESITHAGDERKMESGGIAYDEKTTIDIWRGKNESCSMRSTIRARRLLRRSDCWALVKPNRTYFASATYAGAVNFKVVWCIGHGLSRVSWSLSVRLRKAHFDSKPNFVGALTDVSVWWTDTSVKLILYVFGRGIGLAPIVKFTIHRA
ncbi:hypothetical protein BD310DRAFT_1003719 [Dichomitus squalens]|uniref:Uncharacterized protein n=1 Tax=Dichomitus squalens TaxID=114155 RepID=A0A4Q9PF69_9APHY|nr:hypothetical protein BD310DRAFT_1003719 [Dichomitus squalens]